MFLARWWPRDWGLASFKHWTSNLMASTLLQWWSATVDGVGETVLAGSTPRAVYTIR